MFNFIRNNPLSCFIKHILGYFVFSILQERIAKKMQIKKLRLTKLLTIFISFTKILTTCNIPYTKHYNKFKQLTLIDIKGYAFYHNSFDDLKNQFI